MKEDFDKWVLEQKKWNYEAFVSGEIDLDGYNLNLILLKELSPLEK